jgi:hypothetical protein
VVLHPAPMSTAITRARDEETERPHNRVHVGGGRASSNVWWWW